MWLVRLLTCFLTGHHWSNSHTYRHAAALVWAELVLAEMPPARSYAPSAQRLRLTTGSRAERATMRAWTFPTRTLPSARSAGNADDVHRRAEDRMRAIEAMVAWTPSGVPLPTAGQVKVVPWPDYGDRSKGMMRTSGACLHDLHIPSSNQRIALLFILFHYLVRWTTTCLKRWRISPSGSSTPRRNSSRRWNCPMRKT